jgi:hypothetical protein
MAHSRNGHPSPSGAAGRRNPRPSPSRRLQPLAPRRAPRSCRTSVAMAAREPAHPPGALARACAVMDRCRPPMVDAAEHKPLRRRLDCRDRSRPDRWGAGRHAGADPKPPVAAFFDHLGPAAPHPHGRIAVIPAAAAADSRANTPVAATVGNSATTRVTARESSARYTGNVFPLMLMSAEMRKGSKLFCPRRAEGWAAKDRHCAMAIVPRPGASSMVRCERGPRRNGWRSLALPCR